MNAEVPFKQWVSEEAAKRKVKAHTIHGWFYRGLYVGLKRRKVNQRVIFVQLPTPEPEVVAQAIPEGLVRMKEFVMNEAEGCGVGASAIYMRLHRGKYPNVERVTMGNKRCNYVRIKA